MFLIRLDHPKYCFYVVARAGVGLARWLSGADEGGLVLAVFGSRGLRAVWSYHATQVAVANSASPMSLTTRHRQPTNLLQYEAFGPELGVIHLVQRCHRPERAA